MIRRVVFRFHGSINIPLIGKIKYSFLVGVGCYFILRIWWISEGHADHSKERASNLSKEWEVEHSKERVVDPSKEGETNHWKKGLDINPWGGWPHLPWKGQLPFPLRVVHPFLGRVGSPFLGRVSLSSLGSWVRIKFLRAILQP